MKGFRVWGLFVALLCHAGFAAAPWEPIQGAGSALGPMTMWRPSRNLSNSGIRIPYYKMDIDFKEPTQGFSFSYNAKGRVDGEIDLVKGTVYFKRHGSRRFPGDTITCSAAPDTCLVYLDEVQFQVKDFRRHLDLFREGANKERIKRALDNADLKIKAMRDQIARLYKVEKPVDEHKERFDGPEGRKAREEQARQAQEQAGEQIKESSESSGRPVNGTHEE